MMQRKTIKIKRNQFVSGDVKNQMEFQLTHIYDSLVHKTGMDILSLLREEGSRGGGISVNRFDDDDDDDNKNQRSSSDDEKPELDEMQQKTPVLHIRKKKQFFSYQTVQFQNFISLAGTCDS
jgi:hypothetical protein